MTGDTFEYARQRGTAAKLGQLNPLGRFGVAEGTDVLDIQVLCLSCCCDLEIAQAAVFLASGRFTVYSPCYN